MKKIWIVTNYGGGENYTPSVFTTETRARDWMRELAVNNCEEAYPNEIEDIIYDDAHNLITDDGEEMQNMILDELDDVEVYEDKIIIGDPDDGGNIIQIFEVETNMFTKEELGILIKAMEDLINKTPAELKVYSTLNKYLDLYNKLKEMR